MNDIIKGCCKKEASFQKLLYEKYAKTLFNISLKYCSSFVEAEDNVHDSFLEILNNIHKFKANGSFDGWIKRITINKAIDKFKNKIKFEPIEQKENQLYIDEVSIQTESINLESLIIMIHELPPQYRLVFSLYELDDYTHKEIAKLLFISENTSKSNLYRAKQILKSKVINHLQSKQYGTV